MRDMMATMTPREQIDEVLANETPAGRFQAVIDMLNDGRITPSQAHELLEMPEMAARVSTPVGDITVRADPTLKPDEFRTDSNRLPPYKLAPFRFESREQSVDAMKADARAYTATVMLPGERPDGFAQPQIDEIKAMLTAPVKGKLK